MERQLFLIVGQEEYFLGDVKSLFSQGKHAPLIEVMRGIVEDMVFSDDSSDYTVCSIEVR